MIYRTNLIMIIFLAVGMIQSSYCMESLCKEILQPLELSVDKPIAFRLERQAVSSGWRLHAYTMQGGLTADFFPADPVNSSCAHDSAPLRDLTAISARAFYVYAQRALSKEIVDLWPVNGRCTQPMSELFSKAVLHELCLQAGVADAIGGEQLRLFVLDIKDKIGRYRSIDQIIHSELAMRDMLVNSEVGCVGNRLKKAQSIDRNSQMRLIKSLRASRLSFFLREGFLKAMLVAKVFTPGQIQLFDSPGEENAPGRAAFCMLCELLMNGFKMGYAVRVCSDTRSHTFHPDEFFEYAFPPADAAVATASHESLALCLKQLHGLRLHTLYSDYYRDMYGPSQPYYLALASFFKTAHRLHTPRVERKGNSGESESMITHIALEYPGEEK